MGNLLCVGQSNSSTPNSAMSLQTLLCAIDYSHIGTKEGLSNLFPKTWMHTIVQNILVMSIKISHHWSKPTPWQTSLITLSQALLHTVANGRSIYTALLVLLKRPSGYFLFGAICCLMERQPAHEHLEQANSRSWKTTQAAAHVKPTVSKHCQLTSPQGLWGDKSTPIPCLVSHHRLWWYCAPRRNQW